MACVLLDIGAGSKSFVRDLKFCNFFTPILAFCGEPDWGWLNYVSVGATATQRMIADGRTGSYRVRSQYSEFAFPDSSLDVVTCNAPLPPFWLPVGMEKELARCVKPGGIFFYAYPAPRFHLPLGLDQHGFERVAQGRFPENQWKTVRLKELIPKGLPTTFPPSPTIRNASWVRWLRDHQYDDETHASSYVYSQVGILPTYELWHRK